MKVVKGMQHKLHEWVDKMQKSSKDTRMSDLKDCYLREAWCKYGTPVPFPCGRFDFRMSLPGTRKSNISLILCL
jgi:hypothetical protein